MRESGRLRGAILVTLISVWTGSAYGESVEIPSDLTAPKTVVPAEDQIGPTAEVVEVAPVPEPSTGLLLCAATMAALARRGQRRASRR
jgi:hypothetical protein